MQITTTVLKDIRTKALRVAKEAYGYRQEDEEHVYINEDGDFVAWAWDRGSDGDYEEPSSVKLKLSDLLMNDADTLIAIHKADIERIRNDFAAQQEEQFRIRDQEFALACEKRDAQEYVRLRAKFESK